MEKSKDITESGDTIEIEDATLLMIAVINGSCKCAEALLKAKADPNVPCKAERTALHYAVIKNDIKMVELLLESGAYVDPTDNEENTPLIEAVRLMVS